MKIFFSLLFLFIGVNSYAQDFQYARKVVDTLASSTMQGRGYVKNGDKLAAEYISHEYKKLGLKPYSENFLQKFTMSVNTFPGKMKLQTDKKLLVPGEDYLVDPASPSIEGSYETVTLEAEDFLDEGRLIFKLKEAFGKVLVVEPFNKNDFTAEELKSINDIINFLKYHEDNPAIGTVVLTTDKLTWSVATSQIPHPAITIKVDSAYTPFEKIVFDIQAKFFETYESQNVIGYTEGESDDSLIVLIAHYDHLGMMGKETVFPGANDNASGIAMLLNLANHYQKHKPAYNTVFIAFGAEESGLLGAKYFTENPLFPLEKIKFLLNFDISGTGDEGIQVVNGSVYPAQFEALKNINDSEQLLKQVKIRGEACNSDHCMFHIKGVPSFFIYTLGGVQAYHDIHDKAETLPLTEFEDYFKLITKFVKEL